MATHHRHWAESEQGRPHQATRQADNRACRAVEPSKWRSPCARPNADTCLIAPTIVRPASLAFVGANARPQRRPRVVVVSRTRPFAGERSAQLSGGPGTDDEGLASRSCPQVHRVTEGRGHPSRYEARLSPALLRAIDVVAVVTNRARHPMDLWTGFLTASTPMRTRALAL
jgi:hypothetical protein